MTDLISRLRHEAMHTGYKQTKPWDLLVEAADELERLEMILSRYQESWSALRDWAQECRDQVLYPAAQSEGELGRAAECLGQASVQFLADAAPQQPMRCPTDGGECGAGGYCRPEQRKPLTPSMQAEVECDCLVAWNASTYGHSAQDTVHPMFLSAFVRGYRAAERAHGITGEPT